MNCITIRNAKTDDIDSISRLQRQINQYHIQWLTEAERATPHPEPDKAFWDTWLNDEQHQILLAEQNGLIIGCAMVRETETPHYPHTVKGRHAQLCTLVVDEQYWRQGVGSILIKAVRRWARNRSLGHVMLNACYKNTNAVKFYVQQGFTPRVLQFDGVVEEQEPAMRGQSRNDKNHRVGVLLDYL